MTCGACSSDPRTLTRRCCCACCGPRTGQPGRAGWRRGPALRSSCASSWTASSRSASSSRGRRIRGGRRSSIVDLAGGLRFLGIDIGATSVDVALTDAHLTVVEQSASPSTSQRPRGRAGGVLELVGKARAEDSALEVHGAGVGVPGPVTFRDGVPVAPPIMPGWNQYPVRSVLAQHLGCPSWSTTT